MLTVSPDGKRLAAFCSGGQGTGGPIVKIWAADSDQELFSLPIGAGRSGSNVVFSADDKRVASAGAVWDALTGFRLLTLDGGKGTIAYSPDGKRLATAWNGDGKVKVWDAATCVELLTLEGQRGRGNGVAFSLDGHRLAAGGPNGTVIIYDATPLPERP